MQENAAKDAFIQKNYLANESKMLQFNGWIFSHGSKHSAIHFNKNKQSNHLHYILILIIYFCFVSE
jgi:hypothetical protein